MAIAKQGYEFTEDRWFLNTYYKKGDTDFFYPKQVEHEGHSIVPVKAASTVEAKKAKPASDQKA